ncbi:MAG: CHC2 zinc finger domain-containing protein [Sphingobium limneticum]
MSCAIAPARRSPEVEAAWRRENDELRDRFSLSTIISRKTALKRAGRELVGLCFMHQEKTPSLYVNDQLGLYLCRGCGASGDIFRAVMEIEGLSFIEARRWLGASDLPKADPAARIQARARDDAERAARIDDAHEVWASTVPLAGTPGAAYLESRGITVWRESIRFGRTWAWRDHETGETGPSMPALIGAVVDGAGLLTGLQRIFLLPDGSGKARMDRPKLSLGAVRGGALRLGPPAPEILICEGPEDGLTLAQERPRSSVWVALGTSNMPAIRYPDIVRRIVICSQNDRAGEAATSAAASALLDQGYLVDVAYPAPAYKDWNDQLRGRAR